jgi:hypothetical protein
VQCRAVQQCCSSCWRAESCREHNSNTWRMQPHTQQSQPVEGSHMKLKVLVNVQQQRRAQQKASSIKCFSCRTFSALCDMGLLQVLWRVWSQAVELSSPGHCWALVICCCCRCCCCPAATQKQGWC